MLSKLPQISKSKIASFRYMLDKILEQDFFVKGKTRNATVFIYCVFFKFFAKMSEIQRTKHQIITEQIRIKLSIENIIKTKQKPKQSTEILFAPDFTGLLDVIDQIISDVSNYPRGLLVKNYLHFMIIYCVYLFRFNYTQAVTHFAAKLRTALDEPKHYFFQVTPARFEGLDLMQINALVCQYAYRHITQTTVLKMHQQMNNIPESIRQVIKSRVDRVIAPSDCIKSILKQLLQQSKLVQSSSQNKLFVLKMIYTATNLSRVVSEHVTEKLNVSKTVLAAPIKKLIEKELQVIKARFLKTFRFGHFLDNDFNNYGKYFCESQGQDHRVAPENPVSFSIYRHKRLQIRLHPNLIQTIAKDVRKNVNSFVESAFDRNSEAYSGALAHIYSRVSTNTGSISEFKQIFIDMFDFCGHKCADCGGNCIELAGHTSRHKHYHIPQMLIGRSPTQAVLRPRDKFNYIECKDHSTAISSGHKIFWEWLVLKYRKTILDFYGVATESRVEALSKAQISVINMTPDELINKL